MYYACLCFDVKNVFFHHLLLFWLILFTFLSLTSSYSFLFLAFPVLDRSGRFWLLDGLGDGVGVCEVLSFHVCVSVCADPDVVGRDLGLDVFESAHLELFRLTWRHAHVAESVDALVHAVLLGDHQVSTCLLCWWHPMLGSVSLQK